MFVQVVLLGVLLKAANVVPVNNVNVNDMLTTVSYKLEVYTKTLSELVATVKSLEEKSHNWAIFRHHIDVWNMQMHTMEQKLNAIQSGQDNKHGLGAKLTKVENTLNHILHQMELTVDNCQTQKQQSIMHEREQLNQDYAKTTHVLKKVKNEALARLNNILRYLQKTDNSASICNATVKFEEEQNLTMSADIAEKDLRHLQEHTKKNSKNLELVVKNLGSVQEKLMKWHDNAENNVNYMTKQCQSATKELSTFTESTDLLLKRIEILVRDFGEKLSSANSSFTPAVETRNETEEAVVENTSIQVDRANNEENMVEYEDEAEAEHEINFMQSDKFGCHELDKQPDGIYMFQNPVANEAGRDFNERLCIFVQDAPAWTVIQNRGPYAEQENFNRGWQDYRNGFGELHKDFWFGNEFIHKLTYENAYELRIELEDCAGTLMWAEYKTFQVENENSNYVLIIDDFSGNATDAMSYYHEMDFSTFDHAATKSLQDCWSAATYGGGWWFTSCAEANLNGIYVQSAANMGIIGKPWHEDYSLKRTRMMIRPARSMKISQFN